MGWRRRRSDIPHAHAELLDQIELAAYVSSLTEYVEMVESEALPYLKPGARVWRKWSKDLAGEVLLDPGALVELGRVARVDDPVEDEERAADSIELRPSRWSVQAQSVRPYSVADGTGCMSASSPVGPVSAAARRAGREDNSRVFFAYAPRPCP